MLPGCCPSVPHTSRASFSASHKISRHFISAESQYLGSRDGRQKKNYSGLGLSLSRWTCVTLVSRPSLSRKGVTSHFYFNYWRREGYPLHYSGLENSMDCIVHGVAKSRTRLSDFHYSHVFKQR